MSDDWWTSANWVDTLLGEQDHLGEYATLSKVPLDAITGNAKNQARPGGSGCSVTVDPVDLPYKPGDRVFLPAGQPRAQVPIQQGATNPIAGSLPDTTVEIRFRAFRLPPKYQPVSRPAALDRKMGGYNAADRWLVQWNDFFVRAEEVEPAAGLVFKTRRRRNSDATTEPDEAIVGDWFSTDRPFQAKETHDLGSKTWDGLPKRLLIRPEVSSKRYQPGPELVLEVTLELSGFFVHVKCAWVVSPLAVGRPDPAGAIWPSPTTPSIKVADRGAPSLKVPDFLPPKLVSIGPFHRTFEIVYRLPYARGEAAYYAARQEVAEGMRNYHLDKTWWDLPQNQPKQAGKLINKYRLWPKVTTRSPPARTAPTDPNAAPAPPFDPYDYAAWIHDPGTEAAIEADQVILESKDPVNNNENWCGFFQGFNYTRAGYDNRDRIGIAGIIQEQGIRYDVFFSAPKLKAFFDTEQRPWIAFPPIADAGSRRRWLDEVLARWAPRRGDIIVVNPFYGGRRHHMGHVAMVSRYDPATYRLETIEGNRGRDNVTWTCAGCFAWQHALTEPDGWASIFGIGRFLEGDFDRGVDPDLLAALESGDDHLHVDPEGLPKTDVVKT